MRLSKVIKTDFGDVILKEMRGEMVRDVLKNMESFNGINDIKQHFHKFVNDCLIFPENVTLLDLSVSEIVEIETSFEEMHQGFFSLIGRLIEGVQKRLRTLPPEILSQISQP